jgi:hypothetical protein
MQIIPQLDTNTIQDSTANSIRLAISPDPITSYTAPDGTVISGAGLTITPPVSYTTIDQIQAKIDAITANMTSEQTQLDALNAELSAAQDAVNTVITTAITNGATDARTANLATPAQKI